MNDAAQKGVQCTRLNATSLKRTVAIKGGDVSLGLPAHLAPRTISRSFVSGLHATAFTCLIGSMLLVAVYQSEWPALIMWPAILAIVPMLVALYYADVTKSALFSAAYLVIGGAAIFWFSLTLASQLPIEAMSAATTIALPKIALVLVGGTGTRTTSALVWCSAGFVVAEIASVGGILQSSGSFIFDGTTLSVFVVVMAIVTMSWLAQRGVSRSQASLYSAAREELVAALRHRIEVRAAALLHDTVLNHLSTIAASTDSSMSETLLAQMRRDLALLDGPDWLTEGGAPDSDVDTASWEASGVFHAITEARELGLEVDVTGDLGALARFDCPTSRELGLAVKQCLVNVINHSGAMDAEVAVHSSGDELLLMVVDSGRGFEPTSTTPDRLGLKNSVVARLESVGGGAQVWSTPGRGTSIVLRVPFDTALTSGGLG